jgi:hypothetical protein
VASTVGVVERSEWREEDYLECLRGERMRFAWVLTRHGGFSPEQAEAEAMTRYPYEPADAPRRGLLLHDEAWHWAMLRIHGPEYWREHRERETPPAEYTALQTSEPPADRS